MFSLLIFLWNKLCLISSFFKLQELVTLMNWVTFYIRFSKKTKTPSNLRQTGKSSVTCQPFGQILQNLGNDKFLSSSLSHSHTSNILVSISSIFHSFWLSLTFSITFLLQRSESSPMRIYTVEIRDNQW